MTFKRQKLRNGGRYFIPSNQHVPVRSSVARKESDGHRVETTCHGSFVIFAVSYTVWHSLVWNECPGPGYGTLQRATRNESLEKCSLVWTEVTWLAALWYCLSWTVHRFWVKRYETQRFIHKTCLMNPESSQSSVLIWSTTSEFSRMFRRSRVVACISRVPLCTTRAAHLILLDFVTLQHCWKTALLKFIMSFSPTSCCCPLFGYQPRVFSQLFMFFPQVRDQVQYSYRTGFSAEVFGNESVNYKCKSICLFFDTFFIFR